MLLTPALLWTTAPIDQLALGWPWLLYLGAVATAGAYAIYTVGLRHVPASIAGVTTLLEPLTATILGVALFGERLGAAAGSAPCCSWRRSASCSPIDEPVDSLRGSSYTSECIHLSKFPFHRGGEMSDAAVSAL